MATVRTTEGRELVQFLHELHPGSHYNERVARVEAAAGDLGDLLQRLGAAALHFLRTTHGNELGHDHHCEGGVDPVN